KPPFLSTNSSPENIQTSRATVLPALGLPPDPIANLNPVTNPTFFTLVSPGKFILNAAGLALIGSGGTGVNDASLMAMIDGINKLTAVKVAGATVGFVPNNIFFEHAPHLSNGQTPPGSLVFSQGRTSLFNFNTLSGSYPEQERYGGYASFNDKICDD